MTQNTLRLAHSQPSPAAIDSDMEVPLTGSPPATHSTPQVSVAHSKEDLSKAYELVYEQYKNWGFQIENEKKTRFLTHFGLPTSHTLIVTTQDSKIEVKTVAGALTLVVDGALGLPMEKQYPDEIEALRRSGAIIAEVASLATRRSKDLPTLLSLFYAVHTYALHQQGVTDLCVAVRPEHQNFYKQALLFDQIGGAVPYACCNNAEVVAMRVHLPIWLKRMEQAHTTGRMLGRFFLAKEEMQQIGRQLRTPSTEDLLTRYKFTCEHLDWSAVDAGTAQQIEAAFADAMNDHREAPAYSMAG